MSAERRLSIALSVARSTGEPVPCLDSAATYRCDTCAVLNLCTTYARETGQEGPR